MLICRLRIYEGGRSRDVINLFTQRVAIISCIKSIDGRSPFLGSTLGIGMPNVKRCCNTASMLCYPIWKKLYWDFQTLSNWYMAISLFVFLYKNYLKFFKLHYNNEIFYACFRNKILIQTCSNRKTQKSGKFLLCHVYL